MARVWARLHYRRTILILGALFLVGLLSAVSHLLHMTSKLVESVTLLNATRYSEALTEFRTLYTSEVVARVRDHGIDVRHDYAAHAAAIPLPATLSMALGERLGQQTEGMQVRLYSPYPFAWRREEGGLKDEFGAAAWAFLQQHPDQPFYRFDELQGQRVLRYATADRLRAECVSCHNTHPDTPKDDWQTGDVRGLLEVRLPVGQIEAETNAGLRDTFVLMGGMSLLGLAGLALVIGRFRRASEDLEEQVRARTAELEQANGQLQTEVAEREQAEAALQRSRDELDQRVKARTAELQEEIVERELIEEELRGSEERFRNFSEATFEGIAISERGVMLETNRQFAEMFGYRPEELVGMKALDLSAPETRELVKKHIDMDSEALYESLGLRKDGSTFPIEVRARMIPRGQGLARVTAIRDISGRKQLEDQLRQAQKMEAVGQLTAGVAHNFNNKLQGILMNLELAMFKEGDRAALDTAKTSVLQATEIVGQLMAFSRAEQVIEHQPVRIADVLGQVVEMGRETFEPNIEISADISDDLPAVLGDAVQLDQVFLNFLINARDAVEANPSAAPAIRIAARVSDPAEDPSARSVSRQGDYLRVDVIDNGVGMDEETQQRVFEPFFTTKETGKGTGLGMATAYGIVNNHRGWIECESAPGEGTTFTVYLPVAAGQAVAASPAPEASAETVAGHETLLLVEDEDAVANALIPVLREQGYEVLVARDGEAGWAAFQRERAAIDLVLLDLSMPKMTGQELLQRMRAVDAGVKVIVSSGNVEVDIAPGDMQGLLRKPYSIGAVLVEVRRVLDGR